MNPPSPKAAAGLRSRAAAFGLALAAMVVVVGSFQLGRPGYSVDEEFTEFAVRGIRAHGLPLLPSGLLYDRGLAYSYASAIVNGRIVSLAAAALAIVVVFALVRRHVSDTAAALASLLVTASIPFWATATTARFYAPFLVVWLGSLSALTTTAFGTAGTLGTIAGFAFVARLTHELSFLLAAVPLVVALLTRKGEWLIKTVAVLAGLAAGQALLIVLHALEPSSGETMVRRFFLWQVVNLFERPGERQFGIALAVLICGVVLAPRRAWWWVVSALSVAAMIAAYSIARASNSAPLSGELVAGVLRDGSRYPLDMFWHIAATTPITLVLAIGGIVARLAHGGEWRPAERAAHLLWIGWVLWFGVIESGITTNYLLLPITFMLVAIAIDLDAICRAQARRYALAVTALVVCGVAADQWRGPGTPIEMLEAARPTIVVEGIDEIRDSLQPTDRVVCTDELGCLMLVGRVDRWLALDDFVRERFLVRRDANHVTGVYTGVPAIFRPAEVFSPNPDGSLPDRTIVIDIFKDYPIGNSRSWLPRAIEEDGLQVRPLLETPQLRVLQVSPPERVARLQP